MRRAPRQLPRHRTRVFCLRGFIRYAVYTRAVVLLSWPFDIRASHFFYSSGTRTVHVLVDKSIYASTAIGPTYSSTRHVADVVLVINLISSIRSILFFIYLFFFHLGQKKKKKKTELLTEMDFAFGIHVWPVTDSRPQPRSRDCFDILVNLLTNYFFYLCFFY